MDGWKIRAERSRCPRAGCPLPTAKEHYAVLQLPDCVKRDLCQACFEEANAASGERGLIFWKARRKDGDKRELVLDLESLRVLFVRLEDEPHPNATALRYFVALLLLRKRALKLATPKTPEQEQADILVMDPRAPDQEPIALCGPDLDDARIEALRQELLAMLGEGEEVA